MKLLVYFFMLNAPHQIHFVGIYLSRETQNQDAGHLGSLNLLVFLREVC